MVRFAPGALLSLLLMQLLAPAAHAARCDNPRKSAPGAFHNPDKWGTDDGVVVDGFLDLKGPGGLYAVTHGVDLYRYQVHTDYQELKRCGAQFAILKYKPEYRAVFWKHAQGLRRVGIPAWPYFYISMPSEYRFRPERFDNIAPHDAELAAFRKQGENEAQVAVNLYRNGFSTVSSFGGIQGKVVFIDVEDAIDVKGNVAVNWRTKNGLGVYVPRLSAKDEGTRSTRYAELYGAQVAGWIRRFKDAYPDAIVVLYTNPATYVDYLNNAKYDDLRTYHGTPVWMANYRLDGGEVDWTLCPTGQGKNCKMQHRLCMSTDGGNRCIATQYTSRGVFGVSSPPGAGPLEHIDLSRLFSITIKEDGVGKQYVRSGAYQATPASPAPSRQ